MAGLQEGTGSGAADAALVMMQTGADQAATKKRIKEMGEAEAGLNKASKKLAHLVKLQETLNELKAALADREAALDKREAKIKDAKVANDAEAVERRTEFADRDRALGNDEKSLATRKREVETMANNATATQAAAEKKNSEGVEMKDKAAAMIHNLKAIINR